MAFVSGFKSEIITLKVASQAQNMEGNTLKYSQLASSF